MSIELLQRFENSVVNHATLTSILSHYRAPNAKIHRMVQEGTLIPLKKGLYAVPDGRHARPLSLSLVANHLWGPRLTSVRRDIAPDYASWRMEITGDCDALYRTN